MLRNIKHPTRVYPLLNSYEILRFLWAVPWLIQVLNLVGFAQKNLKQYGFNLGVCVSQKF